MQITPYNFILFGKKDKTLRKADELQIRTKRAFPVMSPTYADSFYFSLEKNSARRDAVRAINDKTQSKIEDMRDKFHYADRLADYNQFDTKMMYILKQLSRNKVGNCNENAKLALAVLCANGYYNSSLVKLRYEVQIINKKTKNVEYKQSTSLNHAFVITDMNKRGKKDIIIDPWLGFADYERGAFGRFNGLYGDDLDDLVTMHKKLFYIGKLEKGELKPGEALNFDDYEIRKGFVYSESWDDNGNRQDREHLGELVRKEYPETVLDVKA